MEAAIEELGKLSALTDRVLGESKAYGRNRRELYRLIVDTMAKTILFLEDEKS